MPEDDGQVPQQLCAAGKVFESIKGTLGNKILPLGLIEARGSRQSLAPSGDVVLIGFLGFHEAIHRLLACRHGVPDLLTASIYMRPNGRYHVEVRDPRLTHDEYWVVANALVWSLRAGDNVAFVVINGIPQRVPLWHWYAYPQPDELGGLILRDQDGRPILIAEERFEAWLIGSGVLEAQPSGDVVTRDRKATAGAMAGELVGDHAAPRLPKAGYEIDDETLLREMARLLECREVSSRWAAAQEVAPRAKGAGTFKSKAKRLHRRFPEWFQKFSESEIK